MGHPFVLAALAATLLFAAVGCDNLGDGSPVPLGLASNLSSPSSRATSPDGTWAGTETVAVYVAGAVDGNGAALSPAADIYDFTVGTDGKLTPPTSPDLYWPADPGQITAYAYYPTTALGTWSHADQSSASLLAAADVLYAPRKSFTLAGSDKALAFGHQLAMIRVSLIKGAIPDAQFNGITAKFWGHTSETFSLPAGQTAAVGSEWTHASALGWVTPWKETSTNTFTALLVPRTVSAGGSDKLFEIFWSDNSRTAPYSPPSALELKAGYLYEYRVTVNKTYVVVVNGSGLSAGNQRPNLPGYTDTGYDLPDLDDTDPTPGQATP